MRWATLEREVEKAAKKRSNPSDAAALRRCLVCPLAMPALMYPARLTRSSLHAV